MHTIKLLDLLTLCFYSTISAINGKIEINCKTDYNNNFTAAT